MGENLALHGVPFVSCHRAKVSAYANDISLFVSRLSDIDAVKKAIVRYEQIAGSKINFDKSEGLEGWCSPTSTFPLE